MYLTIAIHHPKGPDEESALLEAMRRFGEAQRGHKGLVMVTAAKDELGGNIMALAVWDTRENFMAARGDAAKSLEGVDFDSLEDVPRKLCMGEPVVWV
jgi:hypothetical protein